MESRSDFVYYAMSNASQKLYPNNKPQDFKIQLPQPLRLEGDWEVGISSAIYPYTWGPVKSSRFRVSTLGPSSGNAPNYQKWKDGQYSYGWAYANLDIGNQFFNSIEDLLQIVNDNLNAAIDTVSHFPSQNSVTNHEYIKLVLTRELPKRVMVAKTGFNSVNIIELPDPQTSGRDVWRKLGFDDSVPYLIKLGTGTDYDDLRNSNKEHIISKYPANLTVNYPALYVYSPMIHYVGIGDTLAPLLGLLPIKGKPGELIYERFDKPTYNRIAQSYLPEIEISIKDDQGDDVPFQVGKTIFVLHFRRR